MSKYKPRTIKHPVRLQKNGSQKIVYRTVKDIQQLKNSQQIGITTINKQSVMVRKQSTSWVVV
ncbi:ribosomal protein S7-like (plasmid) [Trichormus variabilis NIES-23]|uniref:Ribosomal protein S7-like n=1 Tax=Trichormus variabilis NIES-23 TaxID=1973479 RepID=A0A1Z4KWB4_ANAVA|nr:ribosomal protein S7-like [Trichormus variabilis NIES-23]